MVVTLRVLRKSMPAQRNRRNGVGLVLTVGASPSRVEWFISQDKRDKVQQRAQGRYMAARPFYISTTGETHNYLN